MTLDFFSAFFIGLLGSGHCLAMCGGITTMLTSAIKSAPNKQSTHGDIAVSQPSTKPAFASPTSHLQPVSRLNLVVCYHLGRIGSYCLIGTIVGFTGAIAAKNVGLPIAGLRLIAALFLIFLGLYIGQWLFWLNKVEALGKGLWRYLSPLAKHVIPVDSAKKALGLGAIWGWLPCGLVYSTLTWALASGSAFTGAGIMLFFGLGTLPALVALSFSLASFKKLLAKVTFKKITAISLIAYGMYSFTVAYQAIFN
ncbi:sulfite exporter TauE/SafE family protein [Colwelliaceae bacterium MEBiC 14330]